MDAFPMTFKFGIRLRNPYLTMVESQNTEEPAILRLYIVVSEKFNIHRLIRRGAMMRAKEQGVDEATIEMNNRWQKVQNCQGGLPNLQMSQLNVDISKALM